MCENELRPHRFRPMLIEQSEAGVSRSNQPPRAQLLQALRERGMEWAIRILVQHG